MFTKYVLSTFAIVFYVTLHAQKSEIYTDAAINYKKALELYHNKHYLAAQTLFESLSTSSLSNSLLSDCAYYSASAAVHLNQQNAGQLIKDFIEHHPTSTKRNAAYNALANYYYTNDKYKKAITWYRRVDENAISIKDKETYNFNYGYAAFSRKDYKTAKHYLSNVESSDTYGAQAKYYIGYMAYQGDNYNEANVYFDQVKNKEEYKGKLSYYQAELNFKRGRFKEAIQLAEAQLETSTPKEVSELQKIIGESYFNLKRYNDAIPYLKHYKGRGGKWNNTDYYQLGYAYYQQKNYKKAISEFNKIIGGNTSIAQNAYYHLGESYIHLHKKQEALHAFKNASEMTFDDNIQADAWLNYAKISYDVGNPYQSVPKVLTAYLKKYPESAHREDIEALLIDSYITSKNYEEALQLLKNKTSPESKKAYQKVAFLRGLEVFQIPNYKAAKVLFETSLEQPHHSKFTALALFWKAETAYQLSNFDEALSSFKAFKNEPEAHLLNVYKNLDYNLAYTYFKKKDYTKAISHFKDYVTNKNDKTKLNDAYLRLGDAYFVSSKYNEAIQAYDEAIHIGDLEKDYAYFQKAISYGYAGKLYRKNSELVAFIAEYPQSKLRDDALFALGNSYVTSNNPSNAMATYNQLLSEYKESIFIPKVLLRQGLVYYNNSDYQNALKKFKTVAKTFSGSPEASQAIATIRLIYIDIGKVDEYANWVRTLDNVELTDSDLDHATYQAAEKQFLAHNTHEAIKQFERYITKFPKGLHALPSHFYLAQCYFKKGEKDNASIHYKLIAEAPQNEFSEQALLRYSQLLLERKQWRKAIPLLLRLEQNANFPQHVTFAQSNLMQSYYQIEDYTEAERYAKNVLTTPNIDQKIKTDAQIIIARSAQKTNNLTKAKNAYQIVLKTAKGEVAAEALYYSALYERDAKNYEGSNTLIKRLAKDYSAYKFYGAKGLIVMAKNFYDLKDAYQATYILESVIANFSTYKEIVKEAQHELNIIKVKEAKTNASVTH